jgi:hypothetical protein
VLVQFVLSLNLESHMVNKVGSPQGGFGGMEAGQQSGGLNDLMKRIEELMAKIAQQKGQGTGGSQGGGGSQGAQKSPEEQELEALQKQLAGQGPQQKPGAGRGGQGAGSGSGGGQIQFPSPQ